jgi:rRNA maturation protein Nop10
VLETEEQMDETIIESRQSLGRTLPALIYGAMYAVRCPHCGGACGGVSGADYRVGTTGRCTPCGGSFRLPHPLVPPYDGCGIDDG